MKRWNTKKSINEKKIDFLINTIDPNKVYCPFILRYINLQDCKTSKNAKCMSCDHNSYLPLFKKFY